MDESIVLERCVFRVERGPQVLGRLSVDHKAPNFANFCAICGQLWSRLVSNLPGAPFRLVYRTCPACGGRGNILPLELLLDPTLRGDSSILRPEFLALAAAWDEFGKLAYTIYLPSGAKL